MEKMVKRLDDEAYFGDLIKLTLDVEFWAGGSYAGEDTAVGFYRAHGDEKLYLSPSQFGSYGLNHEGENKTLGNAEYLIEDIKDFKVLEEFVVECHDAPDNDPILGILEIDDNKIRPRKCVCGECN